jgi:hypothetical protein
MSPDEFRELFDRCWQPVVLTPQEIMTRWLEVFAMPLEEIRARKHDMGRRVVQVMEPEELALCIREWLGYDVTACLVVIAEGRVVHTAAWLPALGLVLDDLGVSGRRTFERTWARPSRQDVVVEQAPVGWLDELAIEGGSKQAALLERLRSTLPRDDAMAALETIAGAELARFERKL